MFERPKNILVLKLMIWWRFWKKIVMEHGKILVSSKKVCTEVIVKWCPNYVMIIINYIIILYDLFVFLAAWNIVTPGCLLQSDIENILWYTNIHNTMTLGRPGPVWWCECTLLSIRPQTTQYTQCISFHAAGLVFGQRQMRKIIEFKDAMLSS